MKYPTPSHLEKLIISPSDSLMEALKRLDQGGKKILAVVNDELQLLGVLTDGNLRRHILEKGGAFGTVEQCYDRTPIFARDGDDVENIKGALLKNKIESLPVLDASGRVLSVIQWSDFYAEPKARKKTLDCPVVIMAGGRGTRLLPFTHILPKPLIPINGKPVIEIIIRNFADYGVERFYISLNYKAKLMKAFFEEAELPYEISYIIEDRPLGTAGALKLIEDANLGSLIVSNCDTLLDTDVNRFFSFHKKGNFDATILGVVKNHIVPYGICNTLESGELINIEEKPSYNFVINSGVYAIESEIISHIPKDTPMDTPALLNSVRAAGGKVGVYPISEDAWIDVGQWEEYHRALEKLHPHR